MSTELSAWAERRPPKTEGERAAMADQYAAHMPKPNAPVSVSDADLNAMRAAFIRRFDEDLPRTETLMAVAHIGYRMALRDRDRDGSREAGETRSKARPEGQQPGPLAASPTPSRNPPPTDGDR